MQAAEADHFLCPLRRLPDGKSKQEASRDRHRMNPRNAGNVPCFK